MVMSSQPLTGSPASLHSSTTTPGPLGTETTTPPAWRTVDASDGSGTRLLVWDGPAGPRAVLPEPVVFRRSGGEPELSATFLMTRQPTPDAPDLLGYVERASLGITLSLAPPPAALAAMGSGLVQPLAVFAHELSFALRRRTGEDLCSVRVQDGPLTAALSGTLQRADARALLGALSGTDTGLELCASLAFRAGSPVSSSIELSTDLAVVHQRLFSGSVDGVIYDVDVRNYLEAMIRDGSVRVDASEASAHAIATASVSAFKRAASWLLEPLPDDERRAELGQRFRLSSAPVGSMTIRFRARITSASGPLAWLELKASLSSLLRGITASDASLVHFVSLGEAGRGFETLRRRVQEPATRGRSRGVDASIAASAEQLIAAELRAAAPIYQPPRLQHFPVISSDSKGPLWVDRIDAKRRWYVPELAPVLPDAASTPDASPFLFQLAAVGHNTDGRPALEGTITLTLERTATEATRRAIAALPSGVGAQPVAMRNLRIQLQIPFRDSRGQDAVQSLPAASVVVQGTRIQARFALLDAWARVAYGALSQPGFQARPARVVIDYDYGVYIRTSLTLTLFGEKLVRPAAADQLLSAARSSGDLALRRPATELTAVLDLGALRPEVIGVRPEKFRTVVSKRVKNHVADILVPCASFGALYVEKRTSATGQPESVAVGCQQAYLLGQTEGRQYEALVVPASVAGGRVYRSLQSPGRFLYVPECYRITRFGPDDPERAFRPSVLLYSTVDVDDLGRSRCVILSTLEPSGGAAELQRLREHLRVKHHPAPHIESVSEAAGDLDFTWSLPTGNGQLLKLEVETNRSLRGFEVALVTDAFGLPQMQAILAHSGVTGSARLTLPDGTQLLATLRLHLKEIIGPSPSGAVGTELVSSSRVRLTNRIESPVAVKELLLVDAAGHTMASVPAELRLDPGEDVAIELPSAPAAVIADYGVEATAASLVEIRSFIEDLRLTPILLNRIDLTAQRIDLLRVEVTVPGVPGMVAVEFQAGSDAAQPAEFLLPLTTFLANPGLQLVPLLTISGQVTRKSPITWNLSTQGYVVSLTPALLRLS